jgi:3-oxoacyl-[acyl-carrier-protein] synthase-1
MLAVTRAGMVSALGLDLETSCAAARADMVRIRSLDDLWVFDEAAEESVPLAGHQVPFISAGMFGFARLLQLALAALDDLKAGTSADVPARVGLILLLRSDWHRTAFIEQRKKEPIPPLSPEDEEEMLSLDGDTPPPRWKLDNQELTADRQRLANLLPSLIAHAGIAIEPKVQRTILADQSGFVAALKQAEAWLAKGSCEACWVGGVDSYLDPSTMRALLGLQLLRTPSNPVGFFPGEMACFLELRKPGQKLPSKPLVMIEAFADDPGARSPSTAGQPDAEPLVRAMASAGGGERTAFAVVNFNGTTARANEWGLAQLRRQAQGIADGSALWIPPRHFGEIGSATGPASVALLAHGWARGYAPDRKAMICLMEEGPARGAVVASHP